MIDQKIEADIELLFYGYRAFTAQADALLAERQWGRVHHRVLYFVARHPGVAIHQLLSKLGVSKQALHGPLKALQTAKLITSQSGDHDKRVKNLYLTPLGQQLEHELTSPQRELLLRIESELGAEVTTAWRQMMSTLSQQITSKS
ncbi:MarR family winged helix-turn-helix transcriptional regulator [uncultured Deefgea sp.]|uniref:MarR family winged helix-turn-helix transcriptional regulator n=1 Tax=uncultured Deefgea sp. TaxID=1304914 RepID=UPI0025983523|nr:helix-turn-helix domain-containing protein [uncultured Deefgea sp.]